MHASGEGTQITNACLLSTIVTVLYSDGKGLGRLKVHGHTTCGVFRIRILTLRMFVQRMKRKTDTRGRRQLRGV